MTEKVALEGHMTFGAMTASATAQVDPPGRIVVEDSQTAKMLRHRDGDIVPIYQSVFLVIGGEKKEITVDAIQSSAGPMPR